MDYILHLNNFKCVKMKLFFLLWILPVTLGDTYVTCIYSEECMLPCSSTHLDIIHWYFDKKIVHSYFYNQDQLGHQHEDYKGRTSLLPESEIKKGNISLLIRNIRVQDEGRYKCYAADTNKNDEKYVVMSVEAPVKSVNIRLKDDTVICTSSGVYPEPKVLWYSDPPVMEPPNTTVSRTEDHLYTVTSQLKVDVITDTYTYNCSITNKDTHYTASLKQQGGKIAYIILGIIAAIIIIAAIAFGLIKGKKLILSLRKENKDQKITLEETSESRDTEKECLNLRESSLKQSLQTQ